MCVICCKVSENISFIIFRVYFHFRVFSDFIFSIFCHKPHNFVAKATVEGWKVNSADELRLESKLFGTSKQSVNDATI